MCLRIISLFWFVQSLQLYTLRLLNWNVFKIPNIFKALVFMETYIKTSLKNISANVGLYARNDANIYKPYLVNFTTNICKFLEKKESGIYTNFLMHLITKYTNVNHSCPYTGYLIAKNMVIENRVFPLPPIPKNSYKFVVIFYEGYPLEYLGKVSLYIDLIDDKRL